MDGDTAIVVDGKKCTFYPSGTITNFANEHDAVIASWALNHKIPWESLDELFHILSNPSFCCKCITFSKGSDIDRRIFEYQR